MNSKAMSAALAIVFLLASPLLARHEDASPEIEIIASITYTTED